jgi:hypothetical protein
MNVDLIAQTIDSSGAAVLFGTIVLVSFGLVILAILCGLLILRAVWRWLMRWTWNGVVRSTERKAINGR